jgi:hypothetical protein
LVTLDFVAEIEASTYTNLRDLAASTVLDLPGGITATLLTPPNDYLAFGPSDPILNVTTNNVVLAVGYDSIGNVFVAKDKSLTITPPIDTAGEITVHGTFEAAASTFRFGLDKLTIGAAPAGTDPAVEADVQLPGATFAAASPEIVVNQGSTLSLGSLAYNVNPAGSITLGANARLTIAASGSTLARLKTLSIADGAIFNSTASIGTSFEQLEFLTVHGELNANVTGVGTPANIFRYLQEHVVDGRTGDVIGTGKAVFTGWAVRAADAHAFDQLLGIKDLTVASVTGIPKTSGNETGWTADANKPPAGTEGIILRATTVNVPAGGFTVDRDLNLINTLTFDGAVTINQGAKIVTGPLAGPGLSSGSTSAPVVLVPGGGTTLTAATGTLTVGVSTLAVQLGTTLKVDGTLIAGGIAATDDILAGMGTGEIALTGGTSLNDGLIASKGAIGDTNAAAAITVNGTGTLTIDDDSTVGLDSSVVIIPGGKLVANAGDTLTFGGATSLVIDDGSLTSSTSDTTILTTAAGATISGGKLIITDGNDVLSIGTDELTISSSVIIRGSGTSYDSLEIGGVKLTEAVFDGTVGFPVLTLTGDLIGSTSGSITTKNAGILNIGAIATLTATNGQPLANNVVLNGTAGLTAGTLSLANYAVLTIGGTFTVGDAGAGTAGVTTLDVSTAGSKIAFGGAYNIVLGNVDGTQVSGALKISSGLTLAGLATGITTATGWGATDVGLAGATITAVAMGVNDIYAVTGRPAHGATNSGGSVAVVANGIVTISGSGSSNTITTTTRLGLDES